MTSGAPRPPASAHPRDVGFIQQPMVGWFEPGQLARTGTRALLAGLFGAYADKREMQAALGGSASQPIAYDEYASGDEIWLDYVADLGDGWDSTYSMAWLLSRPSLTVNVGERVETLPRGRILLFGGDQVYPAAQREDYVNRTVGPYRAALPWVAEPNEPHLFAIPGNHDWYDGLTSFIRLFCQSRWIGGWRTQQARSYFAIRLPHRWWLWGVDIQLESDIDGPQLAYFESVAKTQMQPGDRVIIATAEPAWIAEGNDEAGSAPAEFGPHHNLKLLEEKIIKRYRGTLCAAVAGDLHHYARYEGRGGASQRITSGGGGAFLHGTNTLPKRVTLTEDGARVPYTRAAAYPSAGASRQLLAGNLGFPFKNWKFSAILGAFALLFSWVVESASQRSTGGLMQRLGEIPLSEAGAGFTAWWLALAHSPGGVVLLLVLIGGLVTFCDPGLGGRASGMGRRVAVGLAHGLAQGVLVLVLFWWWSRLNLAGFGFAPTDLPQVILFAIEMVVGGGLLGGFVMGLYLWLTNAWWGFHPTEAFSSLRIADHKNFLRLHINREGRLTIYPIGVTRVARAWRFNVSAKDGASWFEPESGRIDVHLIEPPVEIKA